LLCERLDRGTGGEVSWVSESSRSVMPGDRAPGYTRDLAALAHAREVLVSSTVKELVNGSGIVFQPRGTHVLKGVPGEWKLFAPIGEHDPMDAMQIAPRNQSKIPRQTASRVNRVSGDCCCEWPASADRKNGIN
jgi:hypothetical protein